MNDKEFMERVLNKLDDPLSIQKHISLKINLIEDEIKTLKNNAPTSMSKLIEKTETFNKELRKKIRNKIFTSRISNKGSYQQGSLDEKIISKFLEKRHREDLKKLEESSTTFNEKEEACTSKTNIEDLTETENE